MCNRASQFAGGEKRPILVQIIYNISEKAKRYKLPIIKEKNVNFYRLMLNIPPDNFD